MQGRVRHGASRSYHAHSRSGSGYRIRTHHRKKRNPQKVESRSHRREVAVVNSPVAKSRDEECRNRLCQNSHHGMVPGTRECTAPTCLPLNEIRTTYRVCTSPRPRRHSHLAGLLRGSFAPTGQTIYRNTRLRRALSDWPRHSAPLTSDVLCTTANPYRDPFELSVAAPKSKLHTGSFLTTDTRPRAACGKGSPRRCLDLSYSNLKFAPACGFGRATLGYKVRVWTIHW